MTLAAMMPPMSKGLVLRCFAAGAGVTSGSFSVAMSGPFELWMPGASFSNQRDVRVYESRMPTLLKRDLLTRGEFARARQRRRSRTVEELGEVGILKHGDRALRCSLGARHLASKFGRL